MNTVKKKNPLKLVTALMFIALVSVFVMPMMAKAATTHTAHKGHSDHDGWMPISNVEDLVRLGANGGNGYLKNDITLSENGMQLFSGTEVNLCLNGYSIYCNSSYCTSSEPADIYAIYLNPLASLNLYDEKGNSGKISHSGEATGQALYIDGATVRMYGGTITKNKGTQGGGVYVSNGSSFVMKGGIISENKSMFNGGGVYVDETGYFKMEGGKICNNTMGDGLQGTGVYNAGTMEMKGGTISNHTYGAQGGGIYNGGTLTMSGGTVTDNQAGESGGGICSDGTFTMTGGNVSDNYARYGGGGVYSSGTFKMTGGTISGNYTSDDGLGGGVLTEGNFTMKGGDIINNVSDKGGGVVIFSNGTFTLDGGNIKTNTAVRWAGGVYANNKFSMNGGTISDNFSENSGGGVQSFKEFTMTGGTISQNQAGNGAGIEICEGKFTLTGGIISENYATNGGGIFINDGCKVNIQGGSISKNTATELGGGIYTAGDIFISDGTVSDNCATSDGSGLFMVYYSSAIITEGTVLDSISRDQLHSVTYNPNKGSGKKITQYCDFNSNYFLENGYTRSGFTFSGWNTKADGSGKTYTGGKIPFSKDTEVYATWTPSKYTVKFNANGGNGSMSSQSIKYNTSTVLKKNTFTRDGYEFSGWNTKADGSGTSYADAAKVKLKVLNTNKITLYAQWKAKYATVTFNVNGGKTLKETTVQYQLAKAYGTLPKTSRTGYEFNGWYTAKSGGTKVTANSICEGDITLYAHWKAKTDTPYKVEHYRQKVDGTYPATANETEALTGKTNASITPEVKTYKGFTAPETQTVKIKADGKLVVKYYYTRNSYKLTWDFAGGKASGTYTKGTVKYGAKITAPVPTREGYMFNGWDKTVPSKMPANDVTYKAKWRKPTNEEQVRNFVGRFYTIILERPAEEAGLNDWTNKLINKEATGAQVAAGFINSDEFQKKKMTDEEYVTKLYRAFFDREPDKAGYEGWLRELKNGKSRDYVLRGFIGSPEFDNLCKKYGINTGSY